MKIKCLLILVLLGTGFFLANNLISAGSTKHDTAPAENAKKAQAQNYELTAPAENSKKTQAQNSGLAVCRDEAGISDDPVVMDEQALRSYMKRCSYTLLANENFTALDATIAYLRNNKIRTPSGLWLQSLYYAGIEEYLGNVTTEIGLMQTDESLKSWIAGSSDPDAAHMAMTTLMIDKAFLYRGTEVAAKTPEENFERFYQQISATKKYLLEHEDIAARDPEWFTLMLMITRVEENRSEEMHKAYFDKAAKLYPEYYPAFMTAAQMYLPKWGGSKESFDEFAKYAAGKVPAGQGRIVYARIYWARICSECGDGDLPDWREYWSDLQRGFDEIIEQYPDQWNINSYAHIACMAEEKEKTLMLIAKIKDQPISEAWKGRFNYEYCANWSGFSKGR